VDLSQGIDGYLARRSRNFRRSIDRAMAAVRRAGLVLETVTGAPADATSLFERLMSVERRSWKGQDGVGLALPEMEAFYRRMVARLCRRGGLVLTFARNDERDVGYILGALFDGSYRGLQFSYDDDLAAIGLGNALQRHTMEAVASTGITFYDLGAEVDYKYRWCDHVSETVTLVVRR
jgi:CelD/BcsL family acetyltransferase involved in cellulose biosynthesis